MTTTERQPPATLRTVVFGDESDAELTATMLQRLPQRGMAAEPMQRTSTMPRSALRLLDSKILTTTLCFLRADPGPLLLEGLTAVQALMKAARDTRAAPGTSVVPILVRPYTITSMQRPNIALLVDDNEVARVDFQLDVKFGMGKTSVSLRYGAIEAVDCEACSLTVALSLVGASPPLLQKTGAFPVRWDVHPPAIVPLPEDPPRSRTRNEHGWQTTGVAE